jgi:hypothetical protein
MKEPEQSIFPEAMTQRMGVVIMKATFTDKLFGGQGAPAPEDFYRYVLSHEAVDLTIMGLRDLDLFRRVALALSQKATLTQDERARIEEYGARIRASGTLRP